MTLIVKISKHGDDESSQPRKRAKSGSSFADLPDDIFFKICSYLRMQEVWKLGSVCSSWYRMTRSEKLWERADLSIPNLSTKQSRKLLTSLPACVKELKIGGCSDSDRDTINLPTLFHILLERFPQLTILIVENAILTKTHKKFYIMDGFMLNCAIPWEHQIRKYYSVLKYPTREKVTDFSTLVCLLRNVTILSFRNSILAVEDILPCGNLRCMSSMVKILDLTHSPCITDQTIESFCKLPFLEELYLSGTAITINGVYAILTEVHRLKVLDLDNTVVGGETFEVLKSHGQSLVEISLGRTAMRDCDMIDVDEGNFPALRKLCLVHTAVSEISVKKLLNSIPSLMHISVTKSRVKISWVLDQPRYVREKLKYDDCDENEDCEHFLSNKFNGAF